jgi:outer membrane protein OmpA-like peptidoglycan-associated protein
MISHFFPPSYSYILILSSSLSLPWWSRPSQTSVVAPQEQHISDTQVQPLATTAPAPPYFKARISFSPDSTRLSPSAKRLLARSANWLSEHSDARVAIVGLCDPSGSEECRHSLAEKRGNTVRDFLVLRGVKTTQIEAVLDGKGRKMQRAVWRLRYAVKL